MKWYSAVTLYSEYMKTVAKYTEPYGVMPASIYNDHEYEQVPESRRESFRQQVLQGIPLGKGNYLRRFPVWMDYRGHFGTILPQAQAMACAAHLRSDLASSQLANHQLEWIIGRNPFAQSTMYGEGYDFPPLYSPSSGDLVGALPVGIQTRGDSDVPYWPVQSTWTYKEIWVHPVARWVWLMKDLSGPAIVEGQATSSVVFREVTTGQQTEVIPNHKTMRFHIVLPEGNYDMQHSGQAQHITFLPGGSYNLELRPDKALSFEVSSTTSTKGEVTIKVKVLGKGTHHFSLRTDNLTIINNTKELILKADKTGTLEWRARVTTMDTPWVALVIPDDDLSERKEVRE